VGAEIPATLCQRLSLSVACGGLLNTFCKQACFGGQFLSIGMKAARDCNSGPESSQKSVD